MARAHKLAPKHTHTHTHKTQLSSSSFLLKLFTRHLMSKEPGVKHYGANLILHEVILFAYNSISLGEVYFPAPGHSGAMRTQK